MMMFSVDYIRDYVDHMHLMPGVASGDVSFLEFLKETILFSGKTLVGVAWYFISMQWIFGFKEIPLLLSQTYTSVLNTESILEAQLNFSVNQGSFAFLETGSFQSNHLGTGLLNSFFVTLPLSVSQLLTIRALIINGVPSAICSAFGMLLGQFTFFTCVLFGFDFVLEPWMTKQPYVILTGCLLVLSIVHKLFHESPLGPIQASDRSQMFEFFRTTLSLSWCEQICLYSCLGNLTVTTGSSVFQTSDSNFFFSTFGYLIGLTVGSVFWTVIWGYISMALRNRFFALTFIRLGGEQRVTKLLQNGCLALVLTFSLSSFSYHGSEYLFGGLVGFPSEDRSLSWFRNHTHQAYYPRDWEKMAERSIFPIPQLSPDWEKMNEQQILSSEGYNGADGYVSPSMPRSVDWNGLYQLEATGYGPEKFWLNRENDRTRLTDDSRGKQLATLPIIPLDPPLVIPLYESERVRDLEQYLGEKKEAAEFEEFIKTKNKMANGETPQTTDPKELVKFSRDPEIMQQQKAALKELQIKKETPAERKVRERQERFALRMKSVEKEASSSNEDPLNKADYHVESVIDYVDRDDEFAVYKDSTHEEYGDDVEAHYRYRMKYFENPIYRLLLKLDMYPFLLGQSKDQAVNVEQEAELFNHRRLVHNYGNSLLKLKEVSMDNHVSFSRHVSNNQFKGSLSLIRQYKFATLHETMDREPPEDHEINDYYDAERAKTLKKLKVLKYDQPLYHSENQQDYLFHEELGLSSPHQSVGEDEQEDELEDAQEAAPKKPDEKAMKNREAHDFEDEKEIQQAIMDGTELLEIGDQSVPMYIGWDQSMRKFLVKARVSPNQVYTADEVYEDPLAVYENRDLENFYDAISTNPENDNKVEPLSEKMEEGMKPEQGQSTANPSSAQTDRFKIDIPTYYSFQAWSKSVEDLRPGDELAHLPAANYTPEDKENLKIILKILKDDPDQQREVDKLFDRLPNYNWIWKRAFDDSEEPLWELRGYFYLGNTTPPKLQGLAWPGVRDPLFAQELVHKSPFDPSEYMERPYLTPEERLELQSDVLKNEVAEAAKETARLEELEKENEKEKEKEMAKETEKDKARLKAKEKARLKEIEKETAKEKEIKEAENKKTDN
jgi:hypothetical protein